jgi:hypothetical protein
MALHHTVHGSSGGSFCLELPFFGCSIDRKNLVLTTGSTWPAFRPKCQLALNSIAERYLHAPRVAD